MNLDRDQHWTVSARTRDWSGAVVVALVLSIVVLIAEIAIVVFDNPARLASRYSATSELPRGAQGVGWPETDGKAR